MEQHVLVLTRKVGESITIGDDIVLTVIEVRGDSIRLGIQAPRGILVNRSEVTAAVAAANVAASAAVTDDAQAALLAALKAAGA